MCPDPDLQFGSLTDDAAPIPIWQVAKLVQQIVASDERSDPDFDRVAEPRGEPQGGNGEATAQNRRGVAAAVGAAAAADGEEYIMQLTPHEGSQLTGSKTALSTVMRLAGVRLQVSRTDDGWICLTIRGSAASIDNAKRRVESLISGEGEDEIEGEIELAGRTQPVRAPAGGNVDAIVPVGNANAPVPELLMGMQPDGGHRIEIELTNKDQVGAVIGEAGRTINSIRVASGADIQVELTPDPNRNTHPKAEPELTFTADS